jgi:arylsulfatase A-like enzyme
VRTAGGSGPGRAVFALGAASGLAAGGWIGAADALRASLLAPRPFAPADASAIVACWAAAGLVAGGLVGAAAAARSWTPARPRLLPGLLLGWTFLAAWAATVLLPRSVSTPSLAVNVLIAAAAIGALGALALRGYRRLLPRAAALPAAPGRALLLGAAIPLAAAAAGILGSPSGGPGPSLPSRGGAGVPPNVLVVLADSLRADRLGVFGSSRGLTPRLDAFGADAAVFAEARTSSPWTKPSVASLLTGTRPERHGMTDSGHVLPAGIPTLHSLLGAAGWRTGLFSDSHWPVPEFGFGRGAVGAMVVPGAGEIRGSVLWEAWSMGRNFLLDSHGRGTPASIRGARDLSRRFLGWAGEPDPRPWFAYLHWMEPHHPYAPARPSDPGRRPVPVPVHRGVHPFDRGVPMADGDLRALVANYDDEARTVDEAFGALLDALESRGWADRTVIVFLSDHGEEFFEHGGWTHEHSLCEEIVRIPLLVRVPAGPGRGVRIRGQVRIEDVLPTILDLAGLAAPASVDGRTLGPLIAGGSEAPRPSTGLGRRTGSDAVVRSSVLDGWKLLRGDRGPLRTELFFDLSRDPGERNPVEEPPAGRAAALRRLLEEAATIESSRAEPVRTSVAAESRRAIESLGYIGGAGGK